MTSEDFFFKYVALHEIYHSAERLTFDPWLDFFKFSAMKIGIH